jgi:hypothetical protein
MMELLFSCFVRPRVELSRASSITLSEQAGSPPGKLWLNRLEIPGFGPKT